MFWGFFNFLRNPCIRTLPAWPFFGWFWVFFEMLKIPFQFFWNIQNFVLSWKQSVWRKKSMFWGLLNFRQNRFIRTLPAWPFFGWFWVFFEILKIPFQFFRKIQNFVLSWKQSVWRKKSMFWGLFNFSQNRCIRTLPAWPFFGWFWVFFEMLKIPFSILVKHSKFCSLMKTISLKKKKACFGDFSIWTKIDVSGPYRHGHFLVDFEYFLKCWKYPSNSSETFKILFFHENNRFEEKKACFGDFSISRQNRCIWTITGVAIFWLILSIFWNIENTLQILLKHSKFCFLMKTIGLKKKKRVLGTAQFSAKSLYPDLTGVAIFWLILSIFWNVENTLPILVKHSKFCSLMKTISLKKKKACFGYFSIWTKIDVSGPYRRGHFLVDFEYFLKCWKYPSNSSETFKILFFHENNQFEEKKRHVLGTFQFGPKSMYPDLTGMAIFWLILSIFWNIENTLPVLRKHSKFCSFMKTIGLKKKKHILGTFQFLAKSLYPDLTGVAIFWLILSIFLKCWKYPSNSCETFKILFSHENNHFEEKKGMFWVLFNLDQNRCIRTLPAWPFFCWFWVFCEIMKIPFQFFWNIQNFVLSWKQSVWRKKSMFWGLFNFSAKSLYPDLTGVAIFWLILTIFWNVENTLPILRKHSKFCSFMKTIGLKKKSMFWGLFNFWQNRCIRTLPAWPFFGWFWVFFEMLKIRFQILCETFKILFSHENNQFEEKKGMFWVLFNIWTKIDVPGPYRHGDFLVDFEYFLK